MCALTRTDKQAVFNNVSRIVGSLELLMPTINPLLTDQVTAQELHNWVESLVGLVLSETIDVNPAIALGEQLEILDSLQPVDILRVQINVQESIMYGLPETVQLKVYPNLVAVFNGVINGFYLGKTRRAAAIDMSVAAKMGHDLKTPINAITGFSHVILKEIDGPITPFQKEDLTSIYEAGKRLLTMINDLTAVMKQDASRIGIYGDVFKVSELIAEVMANIQPSCASAGHTLSFTLARDLGTMQGDVSKIRWILLSLLLYLSHQGSEWNISLSVDRMIISELPILVFQFKGRSTDDATEQNQYARQVSSIEIMNLDVGLATCWRFCTEIGGSMVMHEGEGIAFRVEIPAKSEGKTGK